MRVKHVSVMVIGALLGLSISAYAVEGSNKEGATVRSIPSKQTHGGVASSEVFKRLVGKPASAALSEPRVLSTLEALVPTALHEHLRRSMQVGSKTVSADGHVIFRFTETPLPNEPSGDTFPQVRMAVSDDGKNRIVILYARLHEQGNMGHLFLDFACYTTGKDLNEFPETVQKLLKVKLPRDVYAVSSYTTKCSSSRTKLPEEMPGWYGYPAGW